jgi:hypothetical protein
MHTTDNLHEGGLAGTILTADSVNLARPDLEADIVESPNSRKLLRHILNFEDVFTIHVATILPFNKDTGPGRMSGAGLSVNR